jgi:hypothetical protein
MDIRIPRLQRASGEINHGYNNLQWEQGDLQYKVGK